MTQRPAPQWGRLPEEMRQRRQWLLASADAKGDLKVPTTLDAAGQPRLADATNPAEWLDFDTACHAAWHYGRAIGYCLSVDDPYCVIDLDVKNQTNEKDPAKWTPHDVVQGHAMIVGTFASYTERSQSGQGLHIWLRAGIPDDDGRGCKRNFVEVYCQKRFMVCTGDIVMDRAIRADEQTQPLVSALVGRIRAEQKDSAIELDEDAEEDWSDAEIVEQLTSQANADKYLELCKGDWRAMGFPSGSELDMALLSMFTFKSRNNEQCRRLFRYTQAGKSERQNNKINRNNDYLNRTLRIIRGRQARELAVEEHGEQVAAALLEKMLPPAAPPVPEPANPIAEAMAGVRQLRTAVLDWPPGFAGVLARFIYNSSPRPVREVAIVSTLGLLAGICGRLWNIPQSGLNMYVVLIARSAVGKEAMHSGISKLVAQLSQHGIGGNAIQQFVDFSKFASGPALTKAVAFNQSFVNISGEWGKTLASMAAEEGRINGPLASLRTTMTDLYQKSAFGSVVGGIAYSDKEKNVASVTGVAYSMIGETTPSTFYESLTDSMMADGFLSRFTLIEYDGDRPEINYQQETHLDAGAANHLLMLTNIAREGLSSRKLKGFVPSPETIEAMHAFNMECDMQINMARDDEATRQMWNRAHLKSMRLAGVLAAADRPDLDNAPLEIWHYNWALTVIRNDITIMTRRLREGDVGINDHSREQKISVYMSDYLRDPVPASYGVPDALRKAAIIPRKYLQLRSQKTPAFLHHRLGAVKALDDTLRSLVDGGYLQEVAREKLVNDFGFHGKAYRILDMSRHFAR